MKCEKKHKKLVKNEYENNNKNRCKNTKQNVDKNKKSEQNINKNINQKVTEEKEVNKIVMQSGITMIALIITIIILLILAGVTINMATSGSGIFGRAKNAANIYRESVAEENTALDEYGSAIEKADRIADGVYNEEQKVNAPVLKQGMTPVKFEINEKDTSKMKTVETTADDKDWYNYKNKQLANAKTEDGSLWVWIPRYAYRIIPPKDDDAERKGTTEIVFLTGLTDSYVDESGKTHTDTKRCKTEDDVIDTTTGYTVHPAFTDESKIHFSNGGWDSELYGIWVAKFEAAYATSSNVSANKVNVSSGINYSQSTVWGTQSIAQKENPTQAANGNYTVSARNYVDGIYGSTKTTIKYPTFQGSSYSMNYINHNDAFLLAQKMTDKQNIYGLSANDTDSHMMKNSEWGVIAYLSKSQYGLSSQNISVNTKNFNDDTNNVYAGTGYNNQGKAWNDTTINFENSASTTGNIYGIYDMSGGAWERTSAYVNNKNGSSHGASVIAGGAKSTKYATAYVSGETSSTTTDDARSEANYNVDKNKKIYGDAVHEASTKGSGNSSWYSDYSTFPEGVSPFFTRGGAFWGGSTAGLLYFHRNGGNSDYYGGFRAVLV